MGIYNNIYIFFFSFFLFFTYIYIFVIILYVILIVQHLELVMLGVEGWGQIGWVGGNEGWEG